MPYFLAIALTVSRGFTTWTASEARADARDGAWATAPRAGAWAAVARVVVCATAVFRAGAGNGARAVCTLGSEPTGTASVHVPPGGVTGRTSTGFSARSVSKDTPERAA